MAEQHRRDHFTFFLSFRNQIDLCEEQDQLKLYRAITDFALFHKDTKFTEPLLNMAWLGIRPHLQKSWTNWENGSNGGAPIGNRNNRKSTESQPKVNRKSTESQAIGKEGKGKDMEEDNKSLSLDEEKFNRFMADKYPHLSKMEKPLTYSQYIKLADGGYNENEINRKLDAMENDKRVPEQKRSCYDTLLNWLENDK